MDFIKICRACTSEKTNLLNLFANDCDDEPTLGEKFLACTSLELQEDDSYPQHICYSCAKLLETAYKFRKQCERSFSQLEKRLLNMQKSTQTPIKAEPSDLKIQKLEPICIDDDDDEDANLKGAEMLDTEEYTEISTPIESRYEGDAEIMDRTAADEPIETMSESPVQDEAEKKIVDVNITIQERQHHCPRCAKNFFTAKALELHMKLTHKLKHSDINDDEYKIVDIQESNLFMCTTCDKQVDNIDDLRMHRILDHGPRSLKCTFCGKSMQDRIAFRKHLLSHKNTERYDCKICGKQYTDSRYLHRHMLYHQVSVYRCEEPNCGKYFNVKHKFVEHIRLYHNRNLSSDEVRQMRPIIEIQGE